MFTERAYQTNKFDNLKKKRKKEKPVLISKVQKIKVICYADLDCLLFLRQQIRKTWPELEVPQSD